ncbi:MAG TPA: hypothetical protein VF783_26095 [Terriglobales bacterium]
MSKAIENLQPAQQKTIAEILRRAVVSPNIWTPAACHSVYLTNDGPVVTVGAALLSSGTRGVPPFDRALIALRKRPGRQQHVSRISGSIMESRHCA